MIENMTAKIRPIVDEILVHQEIQEVEWDGESVGFIYDADKTAEQSISEIQHNRNVMSEQLDKLEKECVRVGISPFIANRTGLSFTMSSDA